MEVNVEKLWGLLDTVAEQVPENSRGFKSQGYAELARRLGVHTPQLHRILNGRSKAGSVFLGKLRKYCTDNDLSFDEFIL